MSVKINVEYIAHDWMTMANFLRSRMNMENDWVNFTEVMIKYLQKAFDEGRSFQKKYPNLEQ